MIKPILSDAIDINVIIDYIRLALRLSYLVMNYTVVMPTPASEKV